MENLDDYIFALKNEIDALQFSDRSSDLFRFQQSHDLKTHSSPAVDAIKEFIYGPVRQWMADITGITLTDQVALSASRYQPGDYLLCHDDELEGRRVAFILYLTSGWCSEYGGSLDIFNTDEKIMPVEIVHSFVPIENSFSFFEVSPLSYHQVSEIIGSGVIRLSVNGWFFGEPLEYPLRCPSPLLQLGSPTDYETGLMVSADYHSEQTSSLLQSYFEETSNIVLSSFLRPEVYEKLHCELSQLPPDVWTVRGPWNKRHYLTLKNFDRTPTLKSLFQLFGSNDMYRILSSLTGLDLLKEIEGDQNEAEASSSGILEGCKTKKIRLHNGYKFFGEVRKFTPGCYTLLHDGWLSEVSENGMALEAIFYVAPSGWLSKFGGETKWIIEADDDDDRSSCCTNAESENSSYDENSSTIVALPNPNSLALVYRDNAVQSYVRYISKVDVKSFADPSYVDIHFTYYE